MNSKLSINLITRRTGFTASSCLKKFVPSPLRFATSILQLLQCFLSHFSAAFWVLWQNVTWWMTRLRSRRFILSVRGGSAKGMGPNYSPWANDYSPRQTWMRSLGTQITGRCATAEDGQGRSLVMVAWIMRISSTTTPTTSVTQEIKASLKQNHGFWHFVLVFVGRYYSNASVQAEHWTLMKWHERFISTR